MTAIRTEGVILQRFTYKETDQIITAFTGEGIIKIAFKGALSKRQGRGALTAPLQLAEFVYAESRGEIAFGREISILNTFLGLRQKLELLESAGEMAMAILSTQQLGNPAPLLYHLFLLYLEALPAAKDPYLIAAGFKLKALRHDGLLAIDGGCAACQRPLGDICIAAGEGYCPEHAPPTSVGFTEAEGAAIQELTYGRSIGRLMDLESTPAFLRKVNLLFTQTI